MKWISVKKKLPQRTKVYPGDEQQSLMLLNHTTRGVGFGNIFVLEEDDIEELEKEFKDKYICSFYFIETKLDGNFCLEIIGGTDGYNDEDVFEHSPHFSNLGTITHWMSLPAAPEEKNEGPL